MGITLPKIQNFGIGMNQTTGSIPASLSNASNLEKFRAAENKLTGAVPSLEELHRIYWFIITSDSLGSEGGNDLSFLCSLTDATRLEGASKSFVAECKALSNIKHTNLLKVLTACSGVDYQVNDFKALVYEFTINGSLEEWLHPVVKKDELHDAPRNLNLPQRLNIAFDAARVLDYLHHNCQTPIAHCDLKPSNILLDGELNGLVGDFGIARFLPEESHNQRSSTGVRGSIGCTAPEQGMGYEVSAYVDVYGLGILLLEIFTGKRPTHEIFKDSLSLHNFVKSGLPDECERLLILFFFRKKKRRRK